MTLSQQMSQENGQQPLKNFRQMTYGFSLVKMSYKIVVWGLLINLQYFSLLENTFKWTNLYKDIAIFQLCQRKDKKKTEKN